MEFIKCNNFVDNNFLFISTAKIRSQITDSKCKIEDYFKNPVLTLFLVLKWAVLLEI